MEKRTESRDSFTGLNPICDPAGKGDSERCVEIPWALSKYSGEQTVLDIGYANAEERYIRALLTLKIPHLHGLDICQKTIDGIISHQGDLRSTDFDDDFFDMVFCISTIEHIGRDNSVYKADSSEDTNTGDFEAFKELYRIIKQKGKIVLTVPFGKFFNYGWFIHYDENRLNKLLGSCPFEIMEMDFFRYEDGWKPCDKSALTETLYKDNNAPAAAGLVCVLLEKRSEKPSSIQKETTYDLDRTMNDNSIEIHDNEINVEEIMEKIRENIRRRQTAGEHLPDPDSVIASPSSNFHAAESDNAIQRDLEYINSNWDIHNNSYFISSHRPYTGKFLVKGRQLVHGEVRRYVDPMISRQVEFNGSTVRLLNRVSTQYVNLESSFERIQKEFDQKISQNIYQAQQELDIKIDTRVQEFQQILDKTHNEIDQKISQNISQAQQELDIKIDTRVQEFQQILDKTHNEIDQKIITTVTKIKDDISSDFNAIKEYRDTELESILKNIDAINPRIEKQIQDLLTQERLQIKDCVITGVEDQFNDYLLKGPKQIPVEEFNYLLFEDRFRGSRDDIKHRQEAFLPYFVNSSNVLDIGCGRGEFLDLLKEHNIGCRGVDIDGVMVASCRARMLDVQQMDAVAYLKTLDDGSLDGIFIDQVVEHLEPRYLIHLLSLCYQKLKPESNIIIETVNPLSFYSFANFYIDMSHKRPVHPETLQYLMSATGFRECETKFFSPVADEGKLQKIQDTPKLRGSTKKNVALYNHNVDILNSLLFGAQDYAVIAKK
jgi:SAM-dependent methyltransferase